MDDVARLPARDRAELFGAAAARRGDMRAQVIEKDFWVCWTLKRILPSKRRLPGSSSRAARVSPRPTG